MFPSSSVLDILATSDGFKGNKTFFCSIRMRILLAADKPRENFRNRTSFRAILSPFRLDKRAYSKHSKIIKMYFQTTVH